MHIGSNQLKMRLNPLGCSYNIYNKSLRCVHLLSCLFLCTDATELQQQTSGHIYCCVAALWAEFQFMVHSMQSRVYCLALWLIQYGAEFVSWFIQYRAEFCFMVHSV